MLIFLDNHRVGVNAAMRIAGYKYREHEKDWVREDGVRGRFHAKRMNSKTLDIHYDLFIEGKHTNFYTPIKHNEERRRILNKLYTVKIYDLNPQQLLKLKGKFVV